MPPPSGNRWTAEEDRTLKELVGRHSTRWKTVALFMATKTDSQCARRWENRFVPRKPRDWTAEEDLALVAGHKMYGKKWKRIATRIGSRSADAARNRWVSLVKRMPLLERNHEYDPVLAQADVSGPQRSSSAATESQSSDGFSTCHHRDASGTALSADTTPLRARTPASGCPMLRAKHEETEVQAALSPVTPPQAESLRRHDAATAETFAPAIKIEARDIATGGGHFGAPSLPWPQDDVGLSSYTQAPSFSRDDRAYERHTSITSLFRGHLCELVRDRLCDAVPELYESAATLAYVDEDPGFNTVDWIPETISAGGDGSLWHSQWPDPDVDVLVQTCSHW